MGKKLIRICSALLCIALMASLFSCASDVLVPRPSDSGDVSNSGDTSDIKDSSDMFVTKLTENGKGLAREVPAAVYAPKAPLSLNERSDYMRWIATDTGTADIRWLDCKTFLSEDDTLTLKKAAPNITFNTDTVWPENMPKGFDPQAIMEMGKNPGLGVRALHSRGITGKGISIAIIDQTLFTGHTEYKDNLALYEEIHVMSGEQASMHGAAVSSIAVGKSCGVAPDAKLYYWAINFSKDPTKRVERYTDDTIAFESGLTVAVDRMLEINKQLPENEKIRVLSISRGFSDLGDDGVKAFMEAIERAKAAGIFVITTSTFQYYDFIDQSADFAGLGKESFTGDPDELSTYTLGTWEQMNPENFADMLLTPMDARTTADFTGEDDYVFYADGGWSWVAPYIAGLYALAAQVNPDITPEEFYSAAMKTSSELKVKIHSAETVAHSTEGVEYTLKHVVNPQALIESFK